MMVVFCARSVMKQAVAGAEAGRDNAGDYHLALPASDAPAGARPGHRRGQALLQDRACGATLPQPPLPRPDVSRPWACSITRRLSPHRHGYALVELLVVMSVNSVLMAVAVAVLGMLLRSGHQGQYHYERATAIMRLADQFRSDVAAARKASLVAGSLQLSGDDTVVELTCDGDRIRRIEKEDAAIRGREAYRLIDLSQAEFIVSESKLVTLVLTFSDGARGIGDVWRIEARLAKDRRYTDLEAQP